MGVLARYDSRDSIFTPDAGTSATVEATFYDDALGWADEDGMGRFVFDEGRVAGGTGFRYLISRVFRIRTGMDFAWSEEGFAFYFTTGTAWGER